MSLSFHATARLLQSLLKENGGSADRVSVRYGEAYPGGRCATVTLQEGGETHAGVGATFDEAVADLRHTSGQALEPSRRAAFAVRWGGMSPGREMIAARRGDYLLLGLGECPKWSGEGCLCGGRVHEIAAVDMKRPAARQAFAELADMSDGVYLLTAL